MPFKSEKQRKYLYSQHPEVAKKFAKEAKAGKKSSSSKGGKKGSSGRGKK
jgi:hypothetical protein